MVLSAVTAALAGLVALGAFWGTAPLSVALVAVTGVFLASWHGALGVPGARGGAAVASAAAAASLALLIGVPALAQPPRPLTAVAPVIGVALVLAFVNQLMREHPRHRVVASVTATTAATVLACFGAITVPAQDTPGGAWLVTAALGGAVAATVLLASTTFSARSLLAVLIGAAVGMGIQAAAPANALLAGAVLGGAGALAALVAAAVAGAGAGAGSRVRPMTRSRLAAAGALPVLVCGPAAYIVGSALAPTGPAG